MTQFKTSPCRGCGAPIVWGKTDEGTRVPLDPKPPVYRVREDLGGYAIERVEATFVSHFATCSSANRFSGRNRKGGDGGKV